MFQGVKVSGGRGYGWKLSPQSRGFFDASLPAIYTHSLGSFQKPDYVATPVQASRQLDKLRIITVGDPASKTYVTACTMCPLFAV